MEQIEDYSVYQREAALANAVQFSQGRMAFTASDVCGIADYFLKYLKGENNG